MRDEGVRDGAARGDRLISLDVLRGLVVMGMILVNSAAGMAYDAHAVVYPALLHAHWDGLTIADVVFPAFVMMVGVSIPMALAGAKAATGLTTTLVRRIAERTFRLCLIGFLLSNLGWLADFDAQSWRFWGVLQRIGLVYGVGALLFLATGPRIRLVIGVAVLILYWPLVLLPSLDGVATDLWVRGHNFAASVDRVMLGAGGHNYVAGREGYDPEGLVGTLPAIAQGLIGIAVGEYLARRRAGTTSMLALAGAGMLSVGLLWAPFFPIVKDIWSSSFVLTTCGITTLLLAACHALFDRRGTDTPGLLAAIATAFGINAVAAYVLHQLTSGMIGWDALLTPYRLTLPFLPPAAASLTPILIYMALIGAAMAWLRRKGWIIKV